MEILVGENKLPGYYCQMSREKRELEPGCRGRAGRDKPRAIPVQSREEATRAQQQGPLGQHRAPLVDPVQIAPGHVRHPDGTCRAVEKLISILAHFVVQLSDTLVGPVLPEGGQDVAKSV